MQRRVEASWKIENSDAFYLYVRVHATNGSDYYIMYLPSDGSPYANGSYAIVPVGSHYKDGTWREVSRDLDADLQTVFGVGVSYVKWFCIRGDYDLDGLVLLDEGEATSYYYFGGQRVAMRQGTVLQYLFGDHLGTTSLALLESGMGMAESRHYPYGEVRWNSVPSGGFPTDYRFAGQREIASAGGIYHMGARFFDPWPWPGNSPWPRCGRGRGRRSWSN